MATQDFRSIRAFPAFKNFTGAETWTEVKLPSNCSRVQIGSITHALFISGAGTQGGAVGADKGFVPANNYLTFQIGRGSTRDSVIYIACQTSATPAISVIMEE